MNIRRFAGCMAMLVCVVSRAAEHADFERIQGVWQAAIMEVDPEAAFDNVRIVFERDLATLYQDGQRAGSSRFTLDSQKPLREIDFTSPDRPAPEAPMKGIYRFRGESLEVCLGATRPSQFRVGNGAELLVFRRPEPEPITAAAAWCLDVSPDGQQLAIAGGERDGRGVVMLLNAADWSLAFSHSEQRAATCLAFSPAGDKLAIGTQIGELAVLDLKTRTVEKRWHSGSWAVFGITWTPDSRDVIAACANGLIKQFSADRGKLRTTFDTWQADAIANPNLGGHRDRNLWDVMVSRDGKTLLSGGWNGTTRVWNLASGKQEIAFADVDRSTQGVRFTPDGRHFVSNSIQGMGARVRATDSREVRAELDAGGRDVAVHPEGELIAASTPRDVRIFRLNLAELSDEQRTQCRELLDQLANAEEKISTAAADILRGIGLPADVVLQQASRTATGELLQRIEQIRHDIKSPAPIATLDGHDGEVRQVVYSPTGNFMATSTITGEVRIWNPLSFQLEHKLILQLNP